jgi:hypothetical protein
MNKPEPQDSRVVWDYDRMKREASRMAWYTSVTVPAYIAYDLADMSPYPNGVKLGIRKQLANDKKITLRQMSILLGWAANKAQR